jgi:type IV secretory pathway VirB2 component (pilin)
MNEVRNTLQAAFRKPGAWVLLFLLVIAMQGTAHAAVGGGGGIFSGLLNYVQGSVVDDIVTLAIMGLGIILLFLRFNPVFVACLCVGIWIVLNPTTIRGWF